MTLVDEGKGSFRDFVVPITTLVAALVGGIGGVFIGGRMNRATMRTLEAERAEREDRLDAAKARRDEAAERRLALGSLRLVVDQFAIAASNLAIERDKAGDNPLSPRASTRVRTYAQRTSTPSPCGFRTTSGDSSA